MNFNKSQLMKTITVLQKKDCVKSNNLNQVKKTLNHLRGKK